MKRDPAQINDDRYHDLGAGLSQHYTLQSRAVGGSCWVRPLVSNELVKLLNDKTEKSPLCS